MLFSMMQSEWFKLRKSKISGIILVGPLLGFLMGMLNTAPETNSEMNYWMTLFMYNSLIYGLLFLPLITGVLAGLITRYEHQAGGWKQILSMPVKRSHVYSAKYVTLCLIVLIIQVLYLVATYTAGLIKGVSDPFPHEIIWKSIFGGWIATFPLLALQLWMSIVWRSFAAPFAVNVMFTLPAIMAANSETFGPIYPWAQPFLMMYVTGDTSDTFFVPWEQVLSIVGGSFLIFFIGGFMYFQRKTI